MSGADRVRVADPTVTLVRPPTIVLSAALATHGPLPPLGLAYVAAAVRERGHAVDLIDAPGEAMDTWVELDSPVGTLQQIGLSPEQVVDRISAATRIVGITNMFFHEWPQVRAIAELTRARLPHALIVLGGENATAMAAWILDECPAVDCIVKGEGEVTMAELVDRVLAGASWVTMAGLATRSPELGLVDTGLPLRIGKKELAGSPRPAWDLVPLDAYWAHSPYFGVDRGRSMQVLGTRGCPYKCSFCSSPQMWTTRYVVREPEDVVDEIRSYVEEHGVRNVNFVDLTAATNRRWTLGLCDAIEAAGLDVAWQLPIGTRIEAIDREVLQRIWDTGCRNIGFAPESGSERVLEAMDKRVKPADVERAIVEASEIGLNVTINILIGHPSETWGDLLKSLRFLARSAWRGCSDISVMMFCPYPGSADFDALVASGRHEIDEASYYVGLSRASSAHRSWNDRMSARQLQLVQLGMLATFYGVSILRHPRRIVAFLRAQVSGEEDTYLDQMVRTRRMKHRASRHATPAVTPHVAEELIEPAGDVVAARHFG